MADKKNTPTIVMPPFNLDEDEMEDLFKALEIDPASSLPGECGKPHPKLGKELVCEKPQQHEDSHERYVKGEWWDWRNLGDK